MYLIPNTVTSTRFGCNLNSLESQCTLCSTMWACVFQKGRVCDFFNQRLFTFAILWTWLHQAGSGVSLSKSKLLHCLLEGTAASQNESVGDEEKDAVHGTKHIDTGMLRMKILPCFESKVAVRLCIPNALRCSSSLC